MRNLTGNSPHTSTPDAPEPPDMPLSLEEDWIEIDEIAKALTALHLRADALRDGLGDELAEWLALGIGECKRLHQSAHFKPAKDQA